ncbi:2-hydroxy-3-oxopropionate reductase [Pseudoalteromonas nigrifaciens]|uniref:2-hydroxy-3-oxopropionate reductase n=1 Tax=Pseudoalteromonas nigrifaciens TaxID=28109 RepID=A0AAC9UEU6_9GAMM|nr:NAD(P)-dependent oxidoreductase [Pseudoalteromonas nigrifaciens]ASM53755.1 2-hydroxy-3-oxopropionate reductase [Pseudoalteromonas nigrifaciens]GEN40747.1 oxidoreductase [Pseudoalteromonas nigrifaciens]SUC52402.1 2-(hydroxymethyl)glutarate dehydrogenase [Pseudoalteromonas nigrifaciens]
MSMKVAFIGLGVMGYPMAGHLAKAGHSVCVYNRTQAKAQKWANEFSGSFAATPREAVNDADIVFMCVGNDDDLRSVVYGENGVLAGIKAGSILVDHTTTSATVAREVAAKAALLKVDFTDAPVSGGQAGAENGVLTVMAGGSEAVFAKVQPVMTAFSRFSQLLGGVGSGQLCKMVNQICIAGAVQGLAEGLHFAKQAGLDGEKVIETISKGAAGSWQMENRYKTMWAGEYDFGFAVDWMRKDLGIALNEAKNNGATLAMTATVDGYYADVQALGGGRYDTSSLLARIEAQHKK